MTHYTPADTSRTLFEAHLIKAHALPVFTDLEPFEVSDLATAIRELEHLESIITTIYQWRPFRMSEGHTGYPTPLGAVLEIFTNWLDDQRDACIVALETSNYARSSNRANDTMERRVALIRHYANYTKVDELAAIASEWKAEQDAPAKDPA